ncbi:hypothetical protein ACA910_000971 [Epithemia clementina (nom. ined.)]
MGANHDTTDAPEAIHLPQGIKDRLAKMGYRIEKHSIKNSSPSKETTGTRNNNELQLLERIAWLEKQVDTLNTKCGSLEAQNILVSVQKLDLFARGLAWLASLSVLYLWWHLVFFITGLLYDRVFPVSGLLFYILLKVLLRGVLLVVPYFYNELTHGSAHRRFQVFAIAFIVIARVRLCRWREKLFIKNTGGNGETNTADDDAIRTSSSDKENKSMSDAVPVYGESITEDTMWEANYEISARFLYVSILRLKGLWTKTAQYLSSRADFMPVSYVRELKRLQDETKATPWEEIQRMIPASVLDALEDVDKTPLASASIGQVHTATFKKTGEKVVIKVQHPHARSLILDDFWSLGVILRVVSWMEPDYEFMEILMKEWAKEAKKELDFTIEAQNLKDAQASIQQLWKTPDSVVYTSGLNGVPFQAEIPTPLDDLSNDQILVMSFCAGVRVDTFEKLDGWGLSRRAVMDGVAQVFAHMMYTTTIFNGDPHPGNLFVRPGTTRSANEGFTLVLLDWGLAKRLTEQKRMAFCELVFAAATLDYGLLMDSYKNIGLEMKKENATLSMENIRFFLRDMAPSDKARKRIKAKIRRDEEHMKTLKKEEKIPMKSKAYPGELFFFIRVNELLHGLGSKFGIDMAYVEVLRPHAERGLRESKLYCGGTPSSAYSIPRRRLGSVPDQSSIDRLLETKLAKIFSELEKEGNLVGAQFYAIDKSGKTIADVVAGNLGGLKSHIPMDRYTLVLGFSCTKAVTATMAHVMVKEGYLKYDEPICEHVWPAFCPTEKPPFGLEKALNSTIDDIRMRWHWKRRISLWHILTHQSGMWSAMPAKLTIKSGANCEQCVSAYEYNEDCPEDTLLPAYAPGVNSEYHYMSFGWLVAGTLCGAYAKKHGLESITFEAVYKAILHPRLSDATKQSGFRPCGGSGGFPLANTAIDDISTTKLLQERRESRPIGDSDDKDKDEEIPEDLKGFRGKEFMFDPRIWNSMDCIDANTPAAGGRFSAMGLANFYHDLGSGRILEKHIMKDISSFRVERMRLSALQGATSTTGDSDNKEEQRTYMGCGYNLIRFDRDTGDEWSAFGHAGVGGSIGFHHTKTGLSVALMLNKADGGREITIRILKVFGEHFRL